MHPRADSTEQDWKACRLSPALSSLIQLPPQTVLCTACAHTGWQHYNVHSIVMKSHTLFRFKVIICGLCLKDLSQAARTVLPPEIFGKVYLWNLCYQIRSFFPRKDFLQPFFSTQDPAFHQFLLKAPVHTTCLYPASCSSNTVSKKILFHFCNGERSRIMNPLSTGELF